jgi:hypothetical protein
MSKNFVNLKKQKKGLPVKKPKKMATIGQCFGTLSTQGSSGTTQGGAMMELIAKGACDTCLTANAKVTFWRTETLTCTNFALESIQQSFNSSTSFGSDAQITLNRTGDLCYWMYIEFALPAIQAVWARGGYGGYGGCSPYAVENACDPCNDGEEPCFRGGIFDAEVGSISRVSSSDESTGDSTGETGTSGTTPFGAAGDEGSTCSIDKCTGLPKPYAHWVNAVGFAVCQRCQFSIGGQVIDTQFNHFLNMWEELSGQSGKLLEEMIGKRYTTAALVRDAQRPQYLYVPLPFYFTRDAGDALPLVSLQFHSFQVNIQLAPIEKLIQISDKNVQVVRAADGSLLSKNDCSAVLDTTYVYLDMAERDAFAAGSFQQVMVQTQQYSFSSSKSSTITANLNFNHPTIELIWAVQRKCMVDRGNYFNYSGAFGLDPITRVSLSLNSIKRFDRNATFFRLVQPYQHHTRIPKSFVYCYSFALLPETTQPSGSVNLSRIDSIELQLCLQPAIQNEDVACYVFARSWNVLRYKDGLGGLMYSSNPVFAASGLAIKWI